MAIDFTDLQWDDYEDLVCDALRAENPELKIERNTHIIGLLSNQKRQIDIALNGKLASHDIFAVVDCKYRSRKIDINEVGSFISFLDDVNADIGILVTQKGYTKAAETLARRSHIKLEIRTPEELMGYKFTLDYCSECDPGEEHPRGTIEWNYKDLDGDVDKVSAIGRCDWCNTLHLRCLKCGTIVGIPEGLYGEKVECEGGCGTIFIVNYIANYLDHYYDEEITVLNLPEQ